MSDHNDPEDSSDNIDDDPYWEFIGIPKPLSDAITGYAGMSMFNSSIGSLLNLVESEGGWTWVDITDCKDKTKKPSQVRVIGK